MRPPAWASTRWLTGLAAMLLLVGAPMARAQTPSPLQEWQYSSGIVLERMFEPTVPTWRAVLGVAVADSPLYDGAHRYRALGGPVINLRYRDLLFLSTGEGLGINVLHGDNYRAGVALGYDLGRKASDDYGHLRGLGDISAAPVIRLFASYVLSKRFPLVLRMNVRQLIGGADGRLGDFGLYLPLPGSSRKLFMFAGPSITIADRRYQQRVFGISPQQSAASGYAPYQARSGPNAVGFGFSATRFLSAHWLVNADMALNRLLGSAQSSPLNFSTIQGELALSTAYQF